MYLLAGIYIEEISQLLTLKLDVRQHATREDQKSSSSVTAEPHILNYFLCGNAAGNAENCTVAAEE